MQHLNFLKLVVGAGCAFLAVGCGIAGEKGTALFTVGTAWDPHLPIAVGAKFDVVARKNDITKAKLAVESANPAVFVATGQADQFEAKGAGAGKFTALATDTKALIDQLEFTAAAPSKLELSYWAERIVDGQASLPETFSLVAGSKLTLRAELTDSGGRLLNHMGLVKSESAATPVLSVASPTGVGHDCVAVAAGASKLTVSASQAVARSYQVSVVAANAVADFDLAASPVVLNLGGVDKGNATTPPASEEGAAATTTVYFALIRAKDANGGKVFGAAGKWSVAEAGVQLVAFSQGVSEVQYLELKKGQKATLHVEISGKSKEIVVIGQ